MTTSMQAHRGGSLGHFGVAAFSSSCGVGRYGSCVSALRFMRKKRCQDPTGCYAILIGFGQGYVLTPIQLSKLVLRVLLGLQPIHLHGKAACSACDATM